MRTSSCLRFLTPVICLLFFSCSSKYRAVNLERFSYQDALESDAVEVSYAHNVQYISRNKWYTKKERKFGMIAVAVRVENKSQETIALSPANLRVYADNDVARKLYTPLEYAEKVKQRTARHLLHALWGPYVFVTESSPTGLTETNVYPLPVGAVVGIANAVRASKANRMNLETLEHNAIWNKVVEPGEVVYGTILIAGAHGDDLTIVYKR